MKFDIAIFRWLNSGVGTSSFLDFVIKFGAVHLIYIVIAAILVFAFLTILPGFRNYRRRNLRLAVTALLSAFAARFIIVEAIRFFYNRPRPFEALENVRQLVDHSSGGSFPSGHAAFSFALATAAAFYYPKTGIIFFAAAFLIGLSRITAGVHWPSDILGGAIVGVLTAVIARYLLRFGKEK